MSSRDVISVVSNEIASSSKKAALSTDNEPSVPNTALTVFNAAQRSAVCENLDDAEHDDISTQAAATTAAPSQHISSLPDVTRPVVQSEATVSGTPSIAPATPTSSSFESLSLELRRAIADELNYNDILSCRLVSKTLAAGVQAKFETTCLSEITAALTRTGLQNLVGLTADKDYVNKIQTVRLVGTILECDHNTTCGRCLDHECSALYVAQKETSSNADHGISLVSILEQSMENLKAADHAPVISVGFCDIPNTRSAELQGAVECWCYQCRYRGSTDIVTSSLLEAIARTNFPVHTLHLCSEDGDVDGSLSGASHTAFKIDPELYADLRTSFANLTTLRLGIGGSWTENLFENRHSPSDSSFFAVFGATTTITHFSLYMDRGAEQECPNIGDETLESIAQTLRHNKLTNIGLLMINAETEHFAAFLTPFRVTLTSLTLDGTTTFRRNRPVLAWIHDDLRLDHLRLVSPGIRYDEDGDALDDRVSYTRKCMGDDGQCVDVEIDGVDAIRERLALLMHDPVYLPWDRPYKEERDCY